MHVEKRCYYLCGILDVVPDSLPRKRRVNVLDLNPQVQIVFEQISVRNIKVIYDVPTLHLVVVAIEVHLRCVSEEEEIGLANDPFILVGKTAP